MTAPTPADFTDDIADLASAEEFLEYFGVAYDPTIVHVNRLHILQRMHDYLAKAASPGYAEYRHSLEQAYADFVSSDALTEKVFKVFHLHEPKTVFVPLDEVFR
jgi:nitrogenase-stabilizing/protective protein